MKYNLDRREYKNMREELLTVAYPECVLVWGRGGGSIGREMYLDTLDCENPIACLHCCCCCCFYRWVFGLKKQWWGRGIC